MGLGGGASHRAVEAAEGPVLDVAHERACLVGRSDVGAGEGQGKEKSEGGDEGRVEGSGEGRGRAYRSHIAVVLKALLKPQPGCAPSTSTERPAGETR